METAKPQSTYAIVSLVSGVLGITFIPFVGSILAVVFGHLGKGEVNRGERSGGGLATGGLVLGYGALALIAAWMFCMGGIYAFGDNIRDGMGMSSNALGGEPAKKR